MPSLSRCPPPTICFPGKGLLVRVSFLAPKSESVGSELSQTRSAFQKLRDVAMVDLAEQPAPRPPLRRYSPSDGLLIMFTYPRSSHGVLHANNVS